MKWLVRTLMAVLVLVIAAAAAVYLIPGVQDRLVSMIIDRALSRTTADLTKDDALRVAICGSGSPMPDLDRSPACNVVIAGGHIFLVDVGPGSWVHVARWNLPLDKLTTVFLTHFHSDHIGDLGEMNLQTWVGQRTVPVTVYGGPGVERVVNGFNEAYAMDSIHRVAHHGPEFLKPDIEAMTYKTIATPDALP